MVRSPLLVVMCVGYFLVLLDVTVVNVALPDIGDTLDTGSSGLQWVVDGYALALAGLLLVAGTVGDVYGHRRVVLTSRPSPPGWPCCRCSCRSRCSRRSPAGSPDGSAPAARWSPVSS